MKDLLRIISYTWELKRYYVATAVFVVIVALLNQANPFLLKFLVDAVVARGSGQPVSTGHFGLLLALLFSAGILISVVTNVQGHIGDLLGAKLHTLLSQRYYDHLLELPLEFYDNEITGKITGRLERSIAGISQLVQAMANNFITFFLSSAFTLVILARYSPLVALLLGLLFPLYIWLTTITSRSWQEKQMGINADTDYANGRFIEAISNIRVVKSFVYERAEAKIFAKTRESIEGQTRAQSKQWHVYDMWRGLSLNVIFFAIYAIIIWQALQGSFGPLQTSIGTVVLMLQLSLQAQFPLFASSFIVDQIQRAAADSKDFFEVMSIVPKIEDVEGAVELEVTEGRVEFRDVSFHYQGGQQVLSHVSFTIEPGTKLALVGESGEGKTTIANLLLRFYEPTEGQILIDGVDISTASQTSLRRNIGVVFQEPALFSGTVAENITYGCPSFTTEQMIAAARAANAHDFIERLPEGYDTQIGERGVKLSGGQKQRVAIARALMKDPPILILDEATSSLDSKAEREVQDALERLMHGRTTLIIAHRLSTIQNVDTIVGIRRGGVAEMGSPAMLADGDGIYAELLRLQAPTTANKAKLKDYDIARV
ncbi:MAG: ABC transporter ATP-binding protein/permease [Actinobacteria bacterium]|nr:ABC transporter ATP-binding protein/permease [Actinomycetota bacterium]